MSSTAATAMRAPAFHKLRVHRVYPLTDDAVEVYFDIPDEMRDAYAYQPGQHLTLRANVGEHGELRRTYSLTTLPDEVYPGIGVRRIPDGRFSGFIHELLHAGDEVDVMTPAGRFTAPIIPDARRHWLLVAAGSGITPIMSILRTVLRDEPGSRVTLLYGNRRVSTIMFLEALEDLKNQYLDRLNILHFLSREKRNLPLLDGRIDAERLRTVDRAVTKVSDADLAFVCGPEPMTVAVRAELTQMGLDPDEVRVELFETAGSPQGGDPRPVADEGAEITCRARIRIRGLESEIDVREGEVILDAAHRAGLEAPYACTAGVCSTCRAHLTEGAVQMRSNHALTDREVAAGYVLTCQSEPTSDEILVDYDRP